MSGKNWWNSAISGLESRLDTILAEDGSTKPATADTAARQDSGDKAAVDKKLAVEQGGLSRNSSRSRPNSRLQERLAKAVTKGTENSRTSSDLGSRPESPALRSPGVAAAAEAGRTSIDSKASEPTEATAAATEAEPAKVQESKQDEPTKASSEATASVASPPVTSSPITPIVSEQPAAERMPTMFIPAIVTPQSSSPRQSIDSNPSSRPSIDVSTPGEPELPSTRDPDILAIELASLQRAHEETVQGHRDELNSHLERIDALQSKLTYLSQQLAASAKAASAESDATPHDKKLAEKDAQIAALMEEGQKLSKIEMKHMTTLKQLRAKGQEQNKEITTLKQRLAKAEKSITEQSERAKRAELGEKAAQEKLKVVDKIEKDINIIRAEREEANLTISELRKQLNGALSRAENAEKKAKAGALEAEKRVTSSLQEDLDNLRIEKKLSEDRAKKEVQAAKEQVKSQQEKANVTELELRGEIAVSHCK